ncbi:MAG: alkaline phosphatase family protein [Oscillospiraceae bacterium]|nr:alkaline phosphatase family protein [Oscillospiraceae bacterium]
MKVLLILIDGMRPDALENIPFAQELKKKASYTMQGTSVVPPVTLPCHMSLFHSVDPTRHGTTTNTYMPQVRPVEGLCEVLSRNKKRCSMFYSWEQLRDIARPGSLAVSQLHSVKYVPWEDCVKQSTQGALAELPNADFVFLYMAYPDDAGHKFGYMSREYLEAVAFCWEHVEQIVSALPEDYAVILTADHGGHDRTHGLEIPEDMTIPMFFLGKPFAPGKELDYVNLKDIAPTVTALLGVEAPEDWEGKSQV